MTKPKTVKPKRQLETYVAVGPRGDRIHLDSVWMAAANAGDLRYLREEGYKIVKKVLVIEK